MSRVSEFEGVQFFFGPSKMYFIYLGHMEYFFKEHIFLNKFKKKLSKIYLRILKLYFIYG